MGSSPGSALICCVTLDRFLTSLCFRANRNNNSPTAGVVVRIQHVHSGKDPGTQHYMFGFIPTAAIITVVDYFLH